MNNSINIPEYSVSEFNKSFREFVDLNFDYVKIKGEISELKTASKGQIYLTLKDDNSILSGVIWENKKKFVKFNPEIGMEVVATGKITTWSKYKTTYQIDIDVIDIAGEGALLKLIEERKKKLEKKGIFDQKNKKLLPFLPNKIGVITSPTGSVIHDIINRIENRFPTKIDLWPVPVQGSDASNLIIKAILGFHHKEYKEKPDVIIIARGGGSTEDLMPFNDENLAMAVFKSSIPIISAIGHETDTTIIDYVSDLRASTPTAAAEIVVPLKIDLVNKVDNLNYQLKNCLKNILNKNCEKLQSTKKFLKAPKSIIFSFKEKFDNLFSDLNKTFNYILFNNKRDIINLSKLLKSPEVNFQLKKERFSNSYNKINKIINDKNKNANIQFNKFLRLLTSNSINYNLKKGYVILSQSKKIIKNSSQLKSKTGIDIKFYDKTVKTEIKKIN